MKLKSLGYREWNRGKYVSFLSTIITLLYGELYSLNQSESQSDQSVSRVFNTLGGESLFTNQVSMAQESDSKETIKGLFEALKSSLSQYPLTSKYLDSVINQNPLLRVAIFSAVIGGTLLFLRR